MTTTQTDAIKLAIEALERNKRGLENIELFGKSNVKFSGLTEMIEKTGAALAALQAREGEAVAKVVLTKTLGLPTMQWLGLDKQFDLADGQLLYTTPPQPAAIRTCADV